MSLNGRGDHWVCDGCGTEVPVPFQLVGQPEADVRIAFENIWTTTASGKDLCIPCAGLAMTEDPTCPNCGEGLTDAPELEGLVDWSPELVPVKGCATCLERYNIAWARADDGMWTVPATPIPVKKAQRDVFPSLSTSRLD